MGARHLGVFAGLGASARNGLRHSTPRHAYLRFDPSKIIAAPPVHNQTNSTNFPTFLPLQAANGGGEDAFVTKLNPAGALGYSTYLGGSGTDSGRSVDVDSLGNAYVTGGTLSANFPTTLDAIQATFGGGFGDAFVTKLNAAGSALVYSTYLGGSSNDGGTGIAVDTSGNAFVSGGTGSTNFPTANPVQLASGGGNDAFVAKIGVPGPTLASISVTPADPTIVLGATLQFTATGTFSDSSTQDLTSSATWITDDPNVATITAGPNGGLATGTGTGSVIIGAASGSIFGLTTLTVIQSQEASCPLGPGYWRKHLSPGTSLTLGSQTYNGSELFEILNMRPGGDASLLLAYQLIAAKLSIANGSDPAPINATIAAADSVLSSFSGKLPYGVSPSSPVGKQMTRLVGILDQYNRGLLTPNCIP